jgi:hypothetical protein
LAENFNLTAQKFDYIAVPVRVAFRYRDPPVALRRQWHTLDANGRELMSARRQTDRSRRSPVAGVGGAAMTSRPDKDLWQIKQMRDSGFVSVVFRLVGVDQSRELLRRFLPVCVDTTISSSSG